jgi:hypothetical protein
MKERRPTGKITLGRMLGMGYTATWVLLRDAFRHPFGEASETHRIWLLPQFLIAWGMAALVGVASGRSGWPSVVAVLVGVALILSGLALTAVLGRAVHRRGVGATDGRRA